jgi:hypothetical protein
MNIDPRAMKVTKALHRIGGEPYIVGGFVKVLVLELKSKNDNIEDNKMIVSDIENRLNNFKDNINLRLLISKYLLISQKKV